MNQFAPLIREISEQLRVPQPARSRILLEIAADLEGIYEHYQEQGMPAEQAAARAKETCVLSGDALESLVRIHQTPFRRLLDRLSEQARTTWERTMLVLVALFIVAVTVRMILAEQLLATASRFLWPVAGMAVIAAVTVLVKAYCLYLKQDHEPRRLRNGLWLLLFLAVMSLGLGHLGAVVELYLTARRIVADDGTTFRNLVGFMQGTSAMLVVSMLVAVAISVLWFVLLGTAQRIERAEAEVLLESQVDSSERGTQRSQQSSEQPAERSAGACPPETGGCDPSTRKKHQLLGGVL